jgi:phosphatidate cytidylyltransferase
LAYLFAVVGFLLLGIPSLMGLNVALFGYMVVFYCLFALSVIVQLWQHSEQPFREAAYTLVPLLYIAVPLALMLTLLQDRGPLVLLMVVAMVWVNDSGAYIGGSLFGRHKMWPRHSPGKTWEGTAFGVLVAILFAVFAGPAVSTIAWPHWLVLALICSIVGMQAPMHSCMNVSSLRYSSRSASVTVSFCSTVSSRLLSMALRMLDKTDIWRLLLLLEF